MKILMVAPTPFFADRGTHIRILEEALALERLGHDITIATYHIGRDIQAEVSTKIDVRRIRRLLFWYKKLEAGPDWQKIFLDLMLVRKAFYIARKKRPDIIHGHLHEGVLIGWIVQKLLFWRKIKLVADFHGSLTKEMVSHSYLVGGWLQKFFRWVEIKINNLGDAAIASSWENSREISQTRRKGEIKTVADGVNLNYYQNLPSKEQSKKELELPLDKTIFAYTGALVPNKGTKYLFAAISEVVRKNNQAYFIIAGFPKEEAVRFFAKNNLKDSVRVVSPLDYFDLPRLLNASDVGIDPKDSSVGQASGKILQYMGAGLPVVCFDRKNNREYLEESGVYCKEISAQGLAQGIQYLTDNPCDIAVRGKTTKKLAARFNWDEAGVAIDKIYHKIQNE